MPRRSTKPSVSDELAQSRDRVVDALSIDIEPLCHLDALRIFSRVDDQPLRRR